MARTSLKYSRNPLIPSDTEGLVRYLGDELDDVAFTIANLALGDTEVWGAVATNVTGDIWTDVNSMDWTGNPHAQGTALYLDKKSFIIFGNSGTSTYAWVGPKDVTVGVGGTYVSTSTDYAPLGSGDHALLFNRDIPNQHPISAITGLAAQQTSQDSAIVTVQSNLNTHTNNLSNPHQVQWGQLTGVPPEFTGAGSTGFVPDPITEQGYVLSDSGIWIEMTGGSGGGSNVWYEEGSAVTVYSANQFIDGGDASTVYAPGQIIDCGDANG